jgi:hypothetical protein
MLTLRDNSWCPACGKSVDLRKPHIQVRENFSVREVHHMSRYCHPEVKVGRQIVWVYPHTHDLGVERIVQV